MTVMTNVLLFIMAIPLLLFGLQFFLCKRNSKGALILPLIVACCFVFLGFYALIIAVIMLAIYVVMGHIAKEKQAKLSELDRMNIEDL